MDATWIAVPVALSLGAVLAAVGVRRVRSETSLLGAEVRAFGGLAADAASVRADAERLAARVHAADRGPGTDLAPVDR